MHAPPYVFARITLLLIYSSTERRVGFYRAYVYVCAVKRTRVCPNRPGDSHGSGNSSSKSEALSPRLAVRSEQPCLGVARRTRLRALLRLLPQTSLAPCKARVSVVSSVRTQSYQTPDAHLVAEGSTDVFFFLFIYFIYLFFSVNLFVTSITLSSSFVSPLPTARHRRRLVNRPRRTVDTRHLSIVFQSEGRRKCKNSKTIIMRVALCACSLSLALALVAAGPIVKRATDEDISPLNEVYVFQNEEDPALSEDGEPSDREKRKIGIIKLGVSNGIINFVFGKLDAFLDAKTRAIAVLDEGNKAKNAAFGIDNTQSATSQFLGNLISQKIQAGTASIGPLINSATTFVSGASSGLSGAFASKLAPLSSIAGSLSGSTGGSSGGSSGGGGGSGNILGGLLSGLSGGSGGLGSLSGGSAGAGATAGSGDNSSSSGSSASAGAGAGINLGAFANLGGGGTISTTTEDIPEFDRTRVSLDIPSPAFGTAFTLITNISKILSSIILNSAHRTQSVLEVFKPFFRGTFAIKGLPSDRQQ